MLDIVTEEQGGRCSVHRKSRGYLRTQRHGGVESLKASVTAARSRYTCKAFCQASLLQWLKR